MAIASGAKEARYNLLFPHHQKGAEALFRTFLLAGNRCFQGSVAALEIGIAHRSKRAGRGVKLWIFGFALMPSDLRGKLPMFRFSRLIA